MRWADRLSSAFAALRGKSAAKLAWGSFRAAYNPRRRSRIIDGSGDYHLDPMTRLRLRSQSRSLERDCDLYDGFLSNWSSYLVGSGPRPVFTTKDQSFNKLASELFAEDAKAKRLDGRRMFPWAQWVTLLARAVARDGDAGVYHLDDGSGLILESEHVVEVEVDSLGRILGYRQAACMANGEASLVATDELIPVGRMSLPAWRTRASQTRGHPPLTSGLDDWERLDSLAETEIITAESSATPWVMLKHTGNAPGGFLPQVQLGGGKQASADPPGAALPTGWVRTAAGAMLGLPPGMDGVPWCPDRPNLNVPEFVRQNLRHLCLPMLPYEIAFLDIGALNYAAIRGLGNLAKRKLQDFRTVILEDTLSRMARDWARAQILAKRLPFTPDFARHRWDWDELEVRDREKDAQADALELNTGTTTLQDRLGPDWRNTVDQRAVERAYVTARGLAAPGTPISQVPVPAPPTPVPAPEGAPA